MEETTHITASNFDTCHRVSSAHKGHKPAQLVVGK